MNNKKIGSEFERKVCEILKSLGCWVHFMTPDARGAQPFDIIAVRNGIAYAIECKTLASNQKFFPITRLEDNQIMAFEKWIECGNSMPFIFVSHNGVIRPIRYDELKEKKKVRVSECGCL